LGMLIKIKLSRFLSSGSSPFGFRKMLNKKERKKLENVKRSTRKKAPFSTLA
jgi:hypothetical protein